MRVNLWSDSQIVLKWISSTKPLKKFVANRVKEIKELIENSTWRYCPTEHNPADLLTRGLTAKHFVENTLWKHGPQWITSEKDWPSWNGNICANVNVSIEEEFMDTSHKELNTHGEDVLLNMSQLQENGLDKIVNLERYSSLRKLLRVTSYVLRFIHNCKSNKDKRTISTLSVEEIQNASIQWIKTVQESAFQEEIKSINSDRKMAIVRQLRLFIDKNGILRSGGRINNAHIKETTKHPFLIPTKHRFTNMIVMDAHENQLHGGVNSTVTQLRQTYWIPRIRQCVRNILNKCVTCKRVIGQSYPKPDPPQLQKDRLLEDIPFQVTGVDFAGPLYVKNSENTTSKVYICLFTCASSRAVHLEIVSNLTEECFILAFRRFVSRRSLPKTMLSDNATTFIAASKEITELTNSSSLQDKLNLYGTTWKFIPKRAPWHGGFWERMVGLTKTCLRKVLGRACIHRELLNTVITEIEAFLNDRPITYVSSDISDSEPLTPSHLLCGRRITCLP